MTGDDADVDAAFERTYALLQQRVEAMLALPVESMTDDALQSELTAIGALEGAA